MSEMSIFQPSAYPFSTTMMKRPGFLQLSLLFLQAYWVVALLAGEAATASRPSIVTGANGYIGREIVRNLIQEYPNEDVYCLVRDQRIEQESQFWSKKSDRVKVMPYDMLDGGVSLRRVLDDVFAGHDVDHAQVYHVASVFGPSENHVQTAKDNVQGTKDLVCVLGEYPQKCRLVVTSSMAAVRGSGQEPKNGSYYTSQDWNTLSKLGENWGSSYQWSKAESERQAWELAKEFDIPMSSICPSFVFGPPLEGISTNSYSITLVHQWVRGESPVQSRLCVDVRDVALAHVRAARAAGRRWIVSHERRIPSAAVAQALQDICAESKGLADPSKITYDADFQGGAIAIGDREVESLNALKEDLGMDLRSVEETMKDMAESLLLLDSKEKVVQ